MPLIDSVSSPAADPVLEAEAPEGAAPPKPITSAPCAKGSATISAYPSSSPQPQPNPCIYADIQKALSTGLTDWAITDRDLDRVQKLLVSMPASHCAATLGQMQRDGLLDRLVGSMEPARRDALLEQLHAKGLFGKTTPIASEGKFDPPTPPANYENAADLPLALRAAIHLSTYEGQQRYAAQYGAYLDRYAAAVEGTKSAEELRDLGPHAKPRNVSEHFDYFDRDVRRFKGQHDTAPSISTNKAALAVQQKLDSFKGKSGVLSVKAMVEGDAIAVRGRITANVDGSGAKAHPEVNLHAGNEAFNVETEGFSTRIKRVELNAEEIGGVAFERDGTVELNGKLTPLLGGYATVNDKEAIYGGGVELGVPGARARLGVEFRGASKEAANMFSSTTSAFDLPAELGHGITWDAVPAGLKQELEYHGWTLQEWERRRTK